MKKNWRQSGILKAICFLAIPVIGFTIFVSSFAMLYIEEYPEVKTATSYFETQAFTNLYKNKLYSCTDTIKKVKNELINRYGDIEYVETNLMQQTEEAMIYYRSYYASYNSNFKYLVYDPVTKEAYTNVERTARTDTIEKIKETLASEAYYWRYQDNTVTTNVKSMALEDLKYKTIFNNIEDNQYQVYTSVSTNLDNSDNFFGEQLGFNIFKQIYKASYFVLPLSIILETVMILYLWIACGHRKGQKDIYLNTMDKIPLEVLGILAIIIYLIEIVFAGIFYEIITLNNIIVAIPFMVALYMIVLTSMYLLGSVIKRVKSHTFLKNTIVFHFVHYIKRKLGSLYQDIIYNFNVNYKLAIIYFGFILISIFLFFIAMSLGMFLGLLLLVTFWIAAFWYLLKRINELNHIKEALKNIYEGKVEIEINEKELQGVLKELAIYVKDIAGGFSNAVEQSLKSERLKTELITNVSHDIKTPLTSIINYVDLLKQEKIENEKAKEYLEVLDNKSQRLKKLIEDLVEASKASSGNIKLTIEKLNMKELMKQVTGEFEDKFKKKGLETIFSFPEEEIYINADSRYMYRVMENMYSNISKYALDNSRVYVDIVKNDSKMLVIIKNISKEKLNISSEELMQRFVRGDSSRNTEGSGLGLSIASSLTELQGGKFDIYLDGDLFKVTIELALAEEKEEK